jgi:hypothetical protein
MRSRSSTYVHTTVRFELPEPQAVRQSVPGPTNDRARAPASLRPEPSAAVRGRPGRVHGPMMRQFAKFVDIHKYT